MTQAPGNGHVQGEGVSSMTQQTHEYTRHRIPRAPVDDEWLAQRAPFVGASSAAALFGDHPFVTLGQLAREKRTGERQPDNPAMARGRFLEEAVAQWWAAEHGVDIAEAHDLYMVNDVLIATLDRIVVDQPVALEVKTTANRVHDVERYWWWQAQAQLACTGFERIEFAVLDGTLRLQSFTVEPDATAMANIVEASGMFLAALRDGTEFDDVDYTAPPTVELNASARNALHAWRVAETARNALDDDIGKLRGILDRALGPCDRGTVNGNEVVRRMHRTVRNAIDTTRLRNDHPDLAREYTKEPTTSAWLVLR